jgi:protein-S-isoprenylcysteine O-methyltransferase Ste14
MGRLRTHEVLTVLERFLLASLWGGFALGTLARAIAAGSPTGYGLVLVNTLIAGLFLTRSKGHAVSGRLEDWLWAIGGTCLPFALRVAGPGHLLGALVQGLGVLAMVYSLVSLRGSFGIVPARRPLVTRGAYAFLRHPLYASELLYFAGVCLSSPSLRNAGIWLALAVVQWRRSVLEERFWSADPAYARYRQDVAGRFLPAR